MRTARKKIYLAVTAIVLCALYGRFFFNSGVTYNSNNQANADSTGTQVVPHPIAWGAYVGDDLTDSAAFETLAGHTMDMQAIFVGWNTPFPSQYEPSVKDAGKTLVIFWEPGDGSGSGSLDLPAYNDASIANGNWDSYMAQFAADAKTYGGPVILVPFEEMNGNWDVWDGTVNGNSSATFIAAWRHVHDLFASAGATNVKFGWDVNNDSVPDTPENAISAYYPGDAYVDDVGVDGFNFGGPWQSFDTIFSSALSQLQTYNKPIYIFSMASAEGPDKAAWITDAITVQIPSHPIAGWIWFNINKEQDWLIDSDPASLAAFKNAL